MTATGRVGGWWSWRAMLRRAPGRVVASTTAALLVGGLVVACGEPDEESSDGAVTSESPTTSDAAPDDAASLDFDARLNGPSTAEPSEVVVLTLTNTGRREDTYGVTVEPAESGDVDTRNVTVRSARSAKVRIQVEETPLLVKVESVGAGGYVDAFTIR